MIVEKILNILSKLYSETGADRISIEKRNDG